MTNGYYSTLDTDYSGRYKSRNQKKIDSICDHMQNEPVKNVLDIGCNQGYVVQSLLDRNIIELGYGIDLDKNIVNPELINNDRFAFFEKDIIKFVFPKKFDVIVYNSVHHHIFANYGSDTAFKVWRKIINNCNQFVFFETAVLTEIGPTLYWKSELGKNYKNDNHMVSDIFAKIGPRLKNIEIIGNNEIHWSKRPLYKISLFPLSNDNKFSDYVKNIYPELFSRDSLWSVEKEMVRSEGSINQVLFDREKLKSKREINKDVVFYILNKKGEDKKYFGKRYINDDLRQIRELVITQKTDHPRILKTSFANIKYGLIFEYMLWQKITEIDFNSIKNKKEFISQIKNFFRFFEREKIEYQNIVNPIANITNRNYLDEIIDLNINNFLVKIERGEISDWKAIDFDFSLVDTRIRNQFNYLSIISTVKRNSKCVYLCKLQVFFYKVIQYLKKQISLRLFYFNLDNIKMLFRKSMMFIDRKITKNLLDIFTNSHR